MVKSSLNRDLKLTLTVINWCCPELLSVWCWQLHLFHAEHSSVNKEMCLFQEISESQRKACNQRSRDGQQVKETVSSSGLSPSWTRPGTKFSHLYGVKFVTGAVSVIQAGAFCNPGSHYHSGSILKPSKYAVISL